MPKILFIAYDFPPANTGGVHRVIRFVNAFAKQGFQVSVITQNIPVHTKLIIDVTLEKEVCPSIDIVRVALKEDSWLTKLLDTGCLFQAESTYYKWQKGLKLNLKKKVESFQPDFILLTMPPFSVAALAGYIKQITRARLVVDFRDAWSHWILTPFDSRLHFYSIFIQERRVLQLADDILVTSKVTQGELHRMHPNIAQKKIHFIPNSFDHYAPNYPLKRKLNQSDPIVIGYVGSFYYDPRSQELLNQAWYKKNPYQWIQYAPRHEDWKYRSPYFFFAALVEMRKIAPVHFKRIKMELIGRKPHWFDAMVKDFNLEQTVTHKGFVSKSESLAFQENCDVLLLTSSKVSDGLDYSIAGKTFEYFSLGKPILGFVCQGAQEWILKHAEQGIVLDPDDTAGNAVAMCQWIDAGMPVRVNTDFVDQFKTSEVFKKLINVLRS